MSDRLVEVNKIYKVPKDMELKYYINNRDVNQKKVKELEISLKECNIIY